MRKNMLMMSLLLLCFLLAGCGNKVSRGKKTGQPESQESSTKRKEAEGSQNETDPWKQDQTAPSGEPENTFHRPPDSSQKKGRRSLRVLGKQSMSCLSDTGYYYITDDCVQIKKDLWGRRIMYMDFATKQEVYLCNEPGCKHNDKNCSAVLTEDTMGMIGSGLLFLWGEKLYLISRDEDKENMMSVDELFAEGEGVSIERQKATTIYSMGLDGTNRKKEYTFAQDVMVDDIVLCDDNNLYFTAKQISCSSKKGKSYYAASKRELVRFQPEKATVETVCSLEFADQVKWNVIGCHEGNVILQGTKYNKKLSMEEEMALEQKEYWEYANDSTEIVAALDLSDGSIKKIYSIKNDADSTHYLIMSGETLYVSVKEDRKIYKVDLGTGKVETLAKVDQGMIDGVLSDKLCCRSWDMEQDKTYYFVDIHTGEVSHSTLVNKRNGWSLELIGESGDQVLAIYDYEAKEEEGDVWDISRHQFGLIKKDDLMQSKDRFQKISMKGPGK